MRVEERCPPSARPQTPHTRLLSRSGPPPPSSQNTASRPSPLPPVPSYECRGAVAEGCTRKEGCPAAKKRPPSGIRCRHCACCGYCPGPPLQASSPTAGIHSPIFGSVHPSPVCACAKVNDRSYIYTTLSRFYLPVTG